MSNGNALGGENWIYPHWQVPKYPYLYPNQTPTVTRPDTKKFDFAEIFKPQPSRERIEKELFQKIAKELKAYSSSDDDYAIWDWAYEIIEEYYVEPEE